MKNKKIISLESIKRLQAQGFTNYTGAELSEHRAGIRFAYQLCTACAIAGLLLKSIPILSFLFFIALIATFYSRHPFDYIYNYGLRHLIHKPKLGQRAIQGNIACGIASAMLALIIYLFYIDAFMGGYIAGGTLISSALLVSTTDICIPSIVYNAIVEKPNPAAEVK